MDVVIKQLRRIAKLAIADVDVDPTRHTLDQLNEWIKRGFRDRAIAALHELEIDKHGMKQSRVLASWDGAFLLDKREGWLLRTTFLLPEETDMSKFNANSTIYEEDGLRVDYQVNARHQNYLLFRLNLEPDVWDPLFRSCEGIKYDENGSFDRESIDKIKKSLQKCVGELKI